MLRLAMRVLTVLRVLGALDSLKAEVSARAKEAARTAALFGIAAMLTTVGLIFVGVAAMLGLATIWPLHWAALTVGGVLIAGAGLMLLAVKKPAGPRRTQQPPPQPANREGEDSVDWSDMLRPIEGWARQNPGKAAFGAVAVGLLIGLLTGGRADDDDST